MGRNVSLGEGPTVECLPVGHSSRSLGSLWGSLVALGTLGTRSHTLDTSQQLLYKVFRDHKIGRNRVEREGRKGTLCWWTGDPLVAAGCSDCQGSEGRDRSWNQTSGPEATAPGRANAALRPRRHWQKKTHWTIVQHWTFSTRLFSLVPPTKGPIGPIRPKEDLLGDREFFDFPIFFQLSWKL